MISLSDSERSFAENYVISLRKDLAAISAGYSPHSAKSIGYEIYNRVHVKEYINILLDEATTTAKETLKLISDTQKSNMSDYMVPVKKWITPTVKKGLAQLIEESLAYIELEDEFCSIKGYTEEAFDKFQEQLENIRDRILRYRIELRINPDAFRLVDGEPIEIETMELDLVLIAKDKERGIIKSFKHTPNGVQVELCDPDVSKEKMAKVHGLYKEDNDQRNISIQLLTNNPLNDTTADDSTQEDIGS